MESLQFSIFSLPFHNKISTHINVVNSLTLFPLGGEGLFYHHFHKILNLGYIMGTGAHETSCLFPDESIQNKC